MYFIGRLLDMYGTNGHVPRQILQIHIRKAQETNPGAHSGQNSTGDRESLELFEGRTENNPQRRETQQHFAGQKGQHKTVRLWNFWPTCRQHR